MKKRFAVGIPTFNSPLALNDFFEHTFDIFKLYSIEVFVYDASDNDNTLNLIKEKWNCSIIHYQKFSTEVDSNTRFFALLENLIPNFDYVWITRDYHYYPSEVLKEILFSIFEDIDMVVLNSSNQSEFNFEILTDKNEFLLKCISPLTMYGAAIVNTNSCFFNVDWMYLKEKYLKTKCNNFSQLGFYYEQMYKKDNIKIKYFHDKNKALVRSAHKHGSLWAKDTIRIWSECWVETVVSISKLYGLNEKQIIAAIRSSPDRFTEVDLLELRSQGYFSEDLYERYIDYLTRVSDVSAQRMHEISKMASEKASSEVESVRRNSLTNFVSKFSKVVIYGAGKLGQKYGAYMNTHLIPFEYFIVSHLDASSKMLESHLIQEYSVVKNRKDVGIILALNQFNKSEVLKTLRVDFNEENLFYDKLF